MAKQGQTRVPNVFRNPLLATQVTDWMRDQLDEYKKNMAEQGKAQRTRRTVQLIHAAIGEIERQADAKLGSQLDDV